MHHHVVRKWLMLRACDSQFPLIILPSFLTDKTKASMYFYIQSWQLWFREHINNSVVEFSWLRVCSPIIFQCSFYSAILFVKCLSHFAPIGSSFLFVCVCVWTHHLTCRVICAEFLSGQHQFQIYYYKASCF